MEMALNLNKPELALKVMEDAVENNPDEPLAYYNLINTYEKCKMFEQAEETRNRLKERFLQAISRCWESGLTKNVGMGIPRKEIHHVWKPWIHRTHSDSSYCFNYFWCRKITSVRGRSGESYKRI